MAGFKNTTEEIDAKAVELYAEHKKAVRDSQDAQWAIDEGTKEVKWISKYIPGSEAPVAEYQKNRAREIGAKVVDGLIDKSVADEIYRTNHVNAERIRTENAGELYQAALDHEQRMKGIETEPEPSPELNPEEALHEFDVDLSASHNEQTK